MQATLVTSTAVSDDAVYKAMKAIFDDEGALKAIHPSLATNFSYAKAVKGIPAPLHAGAVKFFKEKGLNVK